MPETTENMTLEQALERIVELSEEKHNLVTERDSLRDEANRIQTENENLRRLNQKYFNKLIAQESREEKDPEPEPVPTCEEFAKTLV